MFIYVTIFSDRHDIVAEWSKALHLGCSLRWRRFKSCRCHFFLRVTKSLEYNTHIDFYHSVSEQSSKTTHPPTWMKISIYAVTYV